MHRRKIRLGIAAGVMATLLVALLADPAQAHGIHWESGPSPLLLATAAILVVGGLWSVFRRQAGPMGWLGVVAGVAVGVLAFVLAGPSAPNADVFIVEPEVGQEVPAGQPVEVQVRVVGGDVATSPLDQRGGHLHLYVDGKLQQMPYSTSAVVQLSPGTHRLRVEYVDFQHVSFDPQIEDVIEVVAK